MKEESKLREIDRKAYDYILSVWRETGFTPNTTEIAKYFGIGRGGSTQKIFTNLEAEGLILFNDVRKFYIPANWKRETLDFFALSKGYRSVSEIPEANSTEEALERVRELQRLRAKKYREKRKKQKTIKT